MEACKSVHFIEMKLSLLHLEDLRCIFTSPMFHGITSVSHLELGTDEQFADGNKEPSRSQETPGGQPYGFGRE